MSTLFLFKNKKPAASTMRWADKGWLSSPSYYDFWGNVFAQEMRLHFQNKSVADIGAGNGLIWESALRQGLDVRHLRLIDPDLHISTKLSCHPSVEPLQKPLQNVRPFKADTVIFKQSFHMIFGHLDLSLFEIAQARTYLNFAMLPDIDWPVSKEFLTRFKATCPDVRAILDRSGMKVKEAKIFSYPVEISREEWISMIEGRFISCLHDVSDDFIAGEIALAQRNLPQKVRFTDTLEGLIFGRR